MAKNKLIRLWDAILEKLFALGADAIDFSDELIDETVEIAKAGAEGTFEVGAMVISAYDRTADFVCWICKKTFVLIARRIHNAAVVFHKYRRKILQYGLGCVIIATGMIALFASVIDYEYAYNGRTLGIVKDQQDVLDILDMISGELTQEYGASVAIDPETDITFTPVISYSREIDDADTVLSRFTYMGDIQLQAYALYADDQRLAVVESEKVADEVIEGVVDYYLDRNTEYESVNVLEDITVEPYDTTLSRVVSKAAAITSICNGREENVTYAVEEGDTIDSICEQFDITLDEFLEMNPYMDGEYVLTTDDTYFISQIVPLVTVETTEYISYGEVISYQTVYQESDSYYVDESMVAQEGKDGKAKITEKQTRRNGEIFNTEVVDEEILQEAVDKIIVVGTKERPKTEATGHFIRPVNVGISSGFGWRWGRQHTGIDLATSVGTGIMASDGGTVTLSGWYYGYGYTVIIDHGNGYQTLYGHCSALYVSVGEKVYQGQIIAAVGNTGNSTGPHCHFEIMYNGAYLNPANYV